ncbi:MAG: hypothetical protein AAF674_14915 [Pseudomonadota bacterium]
MIGAFHQGEAALVAPFEHSLRLWGTLFGWMMFGDLSDRWTIMGALVLVTAGLYVLDGERQLARAAT